MENRILEFAQSIDPYTNARNISPLQGGFSSQAYKVDASESFVILSKRLDAVSQTNYGHAFVILTLLQKHSFSHFPIALKLNSDQDLIAISFFEGRPSDKFDFKTHNIDTLQLSLSVIDFLLDVSRISYSEYLKTAELLGVIPLPIETPKDNAQEYLVNWFEIVKADCPDKDIVEWLRPRVERMIKKSTDLVIEKATLKHGDPSNPNILIQTNGTFKLIDWDSARFDMFGPESIIGYTTNLTDFMKPYRKEITQFAASKLGINMQVLQERVTHYCIYVGVADINWAAMMMSKVRKGENEGKIEDFRAIALQRIHDYETTYETA